MAPFRPTSAASVPSMLDGLTWLDWLLSLLRPEPLDRAELPMSFSRPLVRCTGCISTHHIPRPPTR
jgi:hypothetical protein